MIVAGASVVALAETGPDEPIRLEYRATFGCPDEANFLERVRARTASVRFVREGAPARVFSVTLAAGPPSWGSVTICNRDREEGARRLEADSCDHVADGVALMVALAVDPHAVARPAPATAEIEASVVPQSAEVPDASSATVEDVDGAPPLPAPHLETPDAAPPPLSPLPPKPPLRYETGQTRRPSSLEILVRHLFVDADAMLATGVSPKTLIAGAPYLGWRSSGRRPLSADAAVDSIHRDHAAARHDREPVLPRFVVQAQSVGRAPSSLAPARRRVANPSAQMPKSTSFPRFVAGRLLGEGAGRDEPGSGPGARSEGAGFAFQSGGARGKSITETVRSPGPCRACSS